MSRRELAAARQQQIAQLAEAVADEYFPEGRVDPAAIVRQKNITLSFGRYTNAFDGMLEWKQNRFHIYCNLDRVDCADSPRARFTLAHELGHFYIDEHRSALKAGRVPAHPSKCEYESHHLAEQEADLFAAHLLMPQERFMRRAKKVKTGLEGVLKLARHFDTSVTSTAIRYAKSNLVPCAVVKWNMKGYAWKWLSTDTFQARFYQTIESREDLPADSATARAIAGAPPPSVGFFQTGTTASFWFKGVRDAGHRNVIFIEQAIPLGRFGVLTFLYPDEDTYSFVR